MSHHDGFYMHNNDSSLSTLKFQKNSNPVSSVGFNTLNKQTTNSSQNSVGTTATNKSTTLSRLFTRNKSSSVITDSNSDTHNQDGLDSTGEEANGAAVKQTSGLFKMTRKLKSKLTFGNKGVNRPELTIQTNGHHTLKVPKKILSSSNADDHLLRKNVPSPISLNYLFSRSGSQTITETQSHPANEIMDTRQAHMKTNPARTAISLSSQNSNSSISDLKFAVIYNFTDPDFLSANDNTLNDTSPLLDLHRKYMTSADYYMLQRLQRMAANDNLHLLALINSANSEDYLDTSKKDHGDNVGRISLVLQETLRPLFQPSKQVLLTNGCLHPQMITSAEQVSEFVRSQYLQICSTNRVNGQRTSAANPEPSSLLYTANSIFSRKIDETLPGQTDEDVSELKIKELLLEISVLLSKCCHVLAKDLQLVHIERENMGEHRSLSLANSTVSRREQADRFSINTHLKHWKTIAYAWKYFNAKVRYFIVSSFYCLQGELDKELRQRIDHDEEASTLTIESMLFVAFRDVLIVPQLLERTALIKDDNTLLALEKGFFEKEIESLKTLAGCFGVISSHMFGGYFTYSEDMRIKTHLFDDFRHRFNSWML